MKNLVIDILRKLAKADAAAKELTAQVEAQSLLLAALVLTVGKSGSSVMATNIEKAILSASSASEEFLQSDADLLIAHFVRLISVSQFVEVNGDDEKVETPDPKL
ncbi:anti-adapter protein IraP [Sodalis sp. RH21]|uniref:anti-adapter protein IraP n=1 Tax=unclassified Sodalis (in: enterobacteria) TaxID=2636512 RepID=UPI0039B408A5